MNSGDGEATKNEKLKTKKGTLGLAGSDLVTMAAMTRSH
jgi:hypothetical protein